MYITAHRPEDLSQLQSHVATEKNAKQRDRYRAVLLALQGQICPQIMDKLGRSKDFVQRWTYAYRDGGIPAIQPKKQPGARPKLSAQQEQEIKARLDAGPRPEDEVCTLRGKDVVRIIEACFEVRYTLRGAYNLLERLGYSCLRPRPQHRKNNPQAMDQFKKDAPLLSNE
jgi:transposase